MTCKQLFPIKSTNNKNINKVYRHKLVRNIDAEFKKLK